MKYDMIKNAAFAVIAVTFVGIVSPTICHANSNTAASAAVEKPSTTRSREDIEKDIAEVVKKNDELNDKVSKSNLVVIDAVKSFKDKKGISKKRLKAFNKNEAAIAEKTELLTKSVVDLKDNAEKISAVEKRLADAIKDLDTVKDKTKSEKDAEIIVHLEQSLVLHTDRNKTLTSIFDILNEILNLIP